MFLKLLLVVPCVFLRNWSSLWTISTIFWAFYPFLLLSTEFPGFFKLFLQVLRRFPFLDCKIAHKPFHSSIKTLLNSSQVPPLPIHSENGFFIFHKFHWKYQMSPLFNFFPINFWVNINCKGLINKIK